MQTKNTLFSWIDQDAEFTGYTIHPNSGETDESRESLLKSTYLDGAKASEIIQG